MTKNRVVELDKEIFADVENLVRKLAKDNNISDVEEVVASIGPETCHVQYKTAITQDLAEEMNPNLMVKDVKQDTLDESYVMPGRALLHVIGSLAHLLNQNNEHDQKFTEEELTLLNEAYHNLESVEWGFRKRFPSRLL